MASVPSLLSYSRSLNPTDGMFFGVPETGAAIPVPVAQKTTLGTMSQFSKDGTAKADGNPQRVEYAALPYGVSVLEIQFGLTVCGAALTPHSCDQPEWRLGLQDIAKAYAEADGFLTLGRLYATNIANARWAWKNRLFASSIAVTVTHADMALTFDALKHPMNDFDAWAAEPGVEELARIIAGALCGGPLAKLRIDGRLDMGAGATVYPSQEFEDKDDGDKQAVGKVLFGVPVQGCDRCAAFHEQKLGNAIRTIDIWHKGVASSGVPVVDAGAPIPVNPYGQSREAYTTVRQKNTGNADFYSLLKKGIGSFAKDLLAGNRPDGIHFVMANLVRGGVFGMKG